MAEMHRMGGSYNALVTQHSRHVPAWASPETRMLDVVVRDGRDSSLSSWHRFRNQGSEAIPLASFLARWVPEHWSPLVTAALDLRRRVPGRSVLVRYEDLAAKPAATAPVIFDFLGIDRSPSTISRCIEATSFSRVSGGRTPGDERIDQFFRKGVAGDWRSAFGSAEIAAFSTAGDEINRLLGYPA